MDTQTPTYSDDELTAALAEHLTSLDRDDSYRVERVLKRSSVETTELVYFEGAGGGSLGPFVRKRIDASAQIGGAHGRLFAAQRAGRRFEHLPRIVDCRRVGDELNVVMEYIEGETLGALVDRLGATPDYARELYPALCDAVGELHAGFAMAGETSAPVIHRDLKPSNIIVTGANYTPDDGLTFSSLVIIDLGIARVWRDGADADTVKFGTRPYAPPEQYGFGQTSVRSDVYALGALLFFCLTGVDPKPGLDMREQCEARGIPTSLADAVCMSMALDPAKRFASAEALGRATRAAFDLSRPVRPPAPVFVRTPALETVLTPQGLQNPTGLPRPAASAACGLLSRSGVFGAHLEYVRLLLAACVLCRKSLCRLSPHRSKPKLPDVASHNRVFFFVDGLMVLMHFALLDKRRLRRRFALLDSYRGKKLAKLWFKALGVLLLCMIVIVAVANATGVVDTSAT